MVGPTNLKPRELKSLDTLIESGVEAGTLAVVLKRLTLGWPPTKSHSSAEKPGPCSWIASQDFALAMVPSI